MRLRTAVASVLVLALASSSALVDAQSDPMKCQSCITNSIMSIKACGSLAFNPTTTTNTDQLTPAEKQCYCTLATNTAWAQPCSTADSCGADFASLLGQGFAAGKDQACQGVNISGNSNSASSIKATAGVALALAAGFTQALL